MLTAFITTFFSIPFDIIYWIKWSLSYIAIRLHITFQKRRFGLYPPNAVGDPEKLGFLIPQIETDLESPQPETHLQQSADEVFFYGVNSKSECLLVRIARRCNQEAEAWIYLKLANGKTYHLSEHANYQQPFEGKCLNFSCGNLQMHCLLPMRRWRIQYCGSLREKSKNKETPEKNIFMKFVFLWTPSSEVYDLAFDTNLCDLASAVARSDWKIPFVPPIYELPKAINFYSQMGNIRGTVSVDENPDYQMYLFGERLRSLGNNSSANGCNFDLLGYVPENGFGIHLTSASAPHLFDKLPTGFAIQPDGDLNVIRDLDNTIKHFDTEKSRIEFQARFHTGRLYELSGSSSAEPVILHATQEWNVFRELFFVSFTVMNKTGYGLIKAKEVFSYKESETIAKLIIPISCPKAVPFTVKFTDDISHLGDISGGKGSSLGKLTELSSTDKTFIVPKGIIVTTSAYKEFLTNDIRNAVKILENVTYGNVEGDVKQACEIVMKNILNTDLPRQIRGSIKEDLKFVFGDGFENHKFAVRSSATGEDTDVMSAAGQMDTFLGEQGLEKIFLAVKKCWASQFGHIAVEYKRQNGQILNSPMAVVIQEMVPCEVAGVIFTCDPVNNNPNIITITANYGLGETVVSGSVEPDTIMLEKAANDHLQIKSINVGSKHQRIVMNEAGGTTLEAQPEDNKINTCITEETAKTLGKLAIRVEKFYRSSRDIEFGMLHDKIYLLQSRPVTSGGAINNFEIEHEFDSVVRCDRDYFTIANVGEVMPGAASPLGIELSLKYMNTTIARQAFENGQVDLFAKSIYYPSFQQLFYNHLMLTVPEIVCRHGHDTMLSKGFMISIFGRVLEEQEIYEVTREKIPFPPPPPRRWDFVKNLFFYNWGLERVKKEIDNYSFPFLKCKTAEETFEALMKSCSDFYEGFKYHMLCSESSSNWNLILFMALLKSKRVFDTDVYSDFGRILAMSMNLESGDVPSSMQNVANQIGKDLGAEKFKAMSIEEAKKWLDTSNTSASQKYRQFIERHGHRCLKEFDIYATPWRQDQKNLIQLLQTLTGCPKQMHDKTNDDYSKLFSELRVNLNFFDRLWLRFVIPNCRKGVQSREYTKSIIVKCMDNWRKGYQHLSKQMVAEGRIPDQELIYFITMEEIKTLLKTRYPKIIARANLRRKMFPVLNRYKFPEIVRGFPKPINEEDVSSYTTEYIADLTMQGIPVSQGVTRGYARVVISLEEATLLKPGDILITYGTDIGWSPYFPILSGVVTELGGLISHGAVLSREYGLPCVVGLRGATKQFKTGDYVLLDGKKGILQRLPHPQE